MAVEMVTTIFPVIWREESSYLYVLMHYPVLVVAMVMFVARIAASRLIIVDNLVSDIVYKLLIILFWCCKRRVS